MSQKETTDSTGRLEGSDSTDGQLSRLTVLAREAHERKSIKDCLDLTRAILLIDPHHSEALQMRTTIQTEMLKDLENAREFLRQAQFKESADPPAPPDANTPELSLDSEAGNLPPAAAVPAPAILPEPAHSPSFKWAATGTPGTRWLLRAGIVIGLVVLALSLPRFRPKSNPAEASPLPAVAPDTPGQPETTPPETSQPGNGPQVSPDLQSPALPAATPAKSAAPVPAPAAVPPLVFARTPGPAAVIRADTAPPDRPVAAAGMLAVSSSTSVDIYKDDVYIGSVPTSLELPAGKQTLEYRHGNLRLSQTHTINSNETTKATINFEIVVPINSKPWAKVYIDGAERKALGETPLPAARVPIGAVLIFENPQFPVKKTRVTGNETKIQMVFP